MAATSNVSPMVKGILIIKDETWKEAKSTFVQIATAVLIKFECLRIPGSFL
jgi:hypothetical protein